ncbi:MAG TPA: alanine dehydrogenase [Bacteroidota bacterium]|nr:alanine dehydrogenase [Bacteroidota bacterium]
MNIGILKEEASIERRVALSPAGVQDLTSEGHKVFVLHQDGARAIFRDEDYQISGATITYSPEEIINRSDVVLKVSPPTDSELQLLHEGQTLFSSLHLAVSRRKVLEKLLEAKVTAVALELIENERGDLSLLQVMSEIAGQIAIQVGAHFLQAGQGGRGTLLGSLPGIPPANVVILGAGTVGRTAARIALGMGANVTVLDKDLSRLRELENLFQWKISTNLSTSYHVSRSVRFADVVIGAVLLKAEKAPHVVSEAMVKEMKPGSVIIDASIDQGGCVETSRPTTIDDPVFVMHGVTHYCVPNMPAVVARTATMAMTNALMPYIQQVSEQGIAKALKENSGLSKGVCTHKGVCTNPVIARIFDFKTQQISELI